VTIDDGGFSKRLDLDKISLGNTKTVRWEY